MFSKVKVFAMVALLAATTLMFSSCSKESQITGKWRVVRASSNDLNVSDDKGEIWTFKEKGDFSGYIGGVDLTGSWSVSGDELTITMDDPLTYSGISWKASGVFSIDELKSQEMTLSGNLVLKNSSYDNVKFKVSYDLEKR